MSFGKVTYEVDKQVAAAPEGSVRVISSHNPFNTHEHVHTFHELKDGLFLVNAINSEFAALPEESRVISVNGGIIKDEDWDTTVIHSGDVVVLFEIPGGGDDSKSIFRLILMIVIAVVAPFATPSTFGPIASATFEVAFIVAGALLINAILPPAIPDAPAGVDSLGDSPTYGIDGAKNTSDEGIPIPICYGGFRMAGNLINFHVRNSGNTQDLYILLNAGEGVIAGISEIELNDQPISGFLSAAVETRLGDNDKTIIPWFEDTISPTAVGVTVDTSFQTRTTGTIDRFRLDFVAPTGLVEFKDDGSKLPRTVTFDIEYKKVSEPTIWTTLFNTAQHTTETVWYHYYQYDEYDDEGGVSSTINTEIRSTLRDGGDTVTDGIIFDVDGIEVGYTEDRPDHDGATSISRRQTSAVRFSFYSPDLVEDTYDIRVKRTTAQAGDEKIRDSITWTDLNEIITDTVGYNNTALVGLKIKLTDQLQSVPNITYYNAGVVIKNWNKTTQTWQNTPSRNPAWIAWNMQTNSRYGGGIVESRIDVDAYIEWGEYCDTEGLEFQGVFDQPMSLWDSLLHVFRAGHAMPVRLGTRHSVAIDRATAPTQMFTVGNIIKGSFSQKWMSLTDRANEVELKYFDETDRFKQRIINVYDDTVWDGTLQKTASVTMFGIVDKTRAAEEATFMLLNNKHIRSTVSFKAPIEAIAVSIGEVFVLQHDQPDWSWGGRLETGSTTTNLEIDRVITLESAKSYKALVRYDSLTIVSPTITTITAGDRRIGLSAAFTGQTNIDRIVKAGGPDLRITRIESNAVWVEDSTGLAVSDAVDIVQTDSIETVDIVAATDGDLTSIPLDTALAQAPAEHVLWMIGESAVVESLWRTTKVTVDEDLNGTIMAAEYNAAIYDWTPLTAQPSPDTGFNRIVPHITNLSADESSVNIGGILRPLLDVSWDLPADFESYAGVMIEINYDGAGYVFAKEHRGELNTTVEVSHADNIDVRVTAISSDGRYALTSTSPEVTGLTMAGDTIIPAVPTGFAVAIGTVGLNLSWVNAIDADFAGIDIKRHPSDDEPSATLFYTTEKKQVSFLDDGAVDTGVTYYYWARSVDQNGNTSAWVASSPTNETPSDFGIDGTTGWLTNEAHGVPSDADGGNPVFTAANGDFVVFKGVTDVTSTCTFSIFAADNLTGTINTAVDTPITGPKGHYEVTAETSAQDVHSFVLRAVTADSITIDRTFTLTKNKQGVDAQTVILSSEGHAFSYDNTDVVPVLIGPTAIDLAVNEQNTTGATTWLAWDDAAVAITPVTDLLSAITDDGATITESDFDGITNNSFVKVRATRNGISDEVTIYKTGTGGDGLSVYVATVYKRSTTPPSAPTVDDGQYNFTTNVLTSPSGWTEAIPTGTDPLYASIGSFSVVGPDGTDTTVIWTAPTRVLDGGVGQPGSNIRITDYDDLDTTQLAAGKSRYAMLTDRTDNTTGSQDNFHLTDAILINKADFDGTNWTLFFSTLEVGDRITFYVNDSRLFIFDVDETFQTVGTGAAEAYKFGVSLVDFIDPSPGDDISTSAGTSVEFQFNRNPTSDGSLLDDSDFDFSSSLPVVTDESSAGFWDNTSHWVGLKNMTSPSSSPSFANWGWTFNSGTGPNNSNTIGLVTAIPISAGITEAWLVSRRRFRTNTPSFDIKLRILNEDTSLNDINLQIRLIGYDAPTGGTAQLTVPQGFKLPYTDGSTYDDLEFHIEAESDVDAQYWEFRIGFVHSDIQDIGECVIDSVFVYPAPRAFGANTFQDDGSGNQKYHAGLVPESDAVDDLDKVLDYAGNWVVNIGTGAVDTVFGRSGAVIAVQADYDAFYPLLGHTHAAADVVSGVFNAARIPTHTGDVTGQTALTIAADAVTYAKMQNVVSGNRLLGRITTPGQVTELTGANVRNILNVEDGATADQTAGEIEAIVNHNNLLGLVAQEHIRWDLTGAEDIHVDRLPSGAVLSVFGRSGAVVATLGDYSNIAEVYTAKQTHKASVAGSAGTRLLQGVAPTSPLAGDIWVTTGDIFARIGSTTKNLSAIASLSQQGIVELATIPETNTGTDATRAVTPDGLDGWLGSAQLSISAAVITSGVLAVLRGGTGVTTKTGTGSVVLSASPNFTGQPDVASLAIPFWATAGQISGDMTISTAVASGGANGDIHFRY